MSKSNYTYEGSLELLPPFIGRGTVYTAFDGSSVRRYVACKNPLTGVMTKLAYARYVYQVDLWRRCKTFIPAGYEVDHINNNPLDDRLENLQLLTSSENSEKRAAFIGRELIVLICPICRSKFTRLRNGTGLDARFNNRVCFCRSRCNSMYHRIPKVKDNTDQQAWLSKHQVLYTTRLFSNAKWLDPYSEIEEFHSREMLGSEWELRDGDGNVVDFTDDRYIDAETMLPIVKEMLDRGVTFTEIGMRFGFGSTFITKFVKKYLPEYTQDAKLERSIASVKELFSQGLTYAEIGAALGMTVANVSTIVRRHIKARRRRDDGENRELWNRMRSLLFDDKRSLTEVARKFNVQVRAVRNLMARYSEEQLPKKSRASDELLLHRVDEIRTLVAKKYTYAEIGRLLDMHTNAVAYLAQTYAKHPHANENYQKLRQRCNAA